MSQDSMTILTREQVCRRLTISPITLHRYVKAGGDFPRKIQLGPRRVGFLASDVERYLAARFEAAEIPAKPLNDCRSSR
jgi:predicted DNA-binding transcriptional regulator AlpA